MALGTDGPASSNRLEAGLLRRVSCTGLQKIRTRDAAAMDANKIIQMATVGGAKAMGLTQSDCLAKGKWADLIMVDLFTPNMQPRNHIVKNIVYSGSKSNNDQWWQGKFYMKMENILLGKTLLPFTKMQIKLYKG